MSQRSNTIKAAGLYTFLSELQAPEGSLVKADNVNIDEMGVATSRRGFNDYGQALPLPDQRVKQILEYKDRIIRHYNDTLSYDDGTENFIDFLGSISEVEDGLRIKSQEVNGNLYFTSSNGIKKLSASTAEDLSSINPVNAGVPKAVDVFAKVSPSEVGFLPPNSKVGYKVLYGYRDKNNVLLLGSPTSVFVVSNTSFQTNIPEQFDIEFLQSGANFVDGTTDISKYFLLSTKNTDYYVWYNLTDAATGDETKKPENSETFGKIEIKVDIESTDVANVVAAKTANVLLNSLSGFYEVSLVGAIVTLISQEDGNIKDPTDGDMTTQISIDKVQEGSLQLGTSANCEITTTIPSGVDSTFFIQIYRTQFITATEDQELLDISPGEECNLVYEQALTGFQEGDIFTHIDDVTESFRDSGTPLYNNPFSGEGLLQTNEVPPISKDIESFNNYTFYSNTKTFHRAQFTFISVNDFKNEETALYIGNEDNLRQYVFRGTQQVTTIVCDTINNTKENEIESNTLTVSDFAGTVESTEADPSYIKIYSRENENKYYIWYNKGTGVDPKQATTPPTELNDTFTGIQVLLSGGETVEEVANKTISLLQTLQDFNVSIDSGSFDITVVNQKAGYAGDGSGGLVLFNQPNMSVSNIKEGHSSYITLYSADDEFKYYIWFDKGSGIDPLVESAISVKVNLTNELLTGTENVSSYLNNALLDIIDFTTAYDETEDTTVTITNVENGKSTEASTPNNNAATDIGTGWTITSTLGTGEDASNNYCKWSIDPSLGISIERTARSFVRVVNQDQSSPVNAFYLSGDADNPGLILLENKNLEDKPFYIGVGNIGTIGSDISNEFDPAIPFVKTPISDIELDIVENNSIVTFTIHGLQTGDEIYLYVSGDLPETPQVSSTFTATKINDNTFSIDLTDEIDLTGTTSYFFKTDLKSENEEKQNRIYYSKLLQPEAVPIANYIDVGGKNEPIERILALRDTLFILKTDGVYTLTGFAPPFNVRLLDNTSKIIAPDSAAILSNQIYTLTEDGVVTITESGVAIVSRPIEDKILDVTKESFDFKSKIVATSYQNDKAYIIWLPTSEEDEVATQAYRYNFFEKTWTRWTVPVTSALVSRKNVLYIGNGDRQYLQKERKNRDRTDYADRNFTVQIPENSINQKIIRLNDYSEVEIGDVFVQEQYITIDRFNNLLAKFNLDPGCDLDYETEDLIAKPGDNIASNLSLLNTRLIQDGISLTLQTWNNSDLEALKDTYNVFIGQLNELNSGTGFKTYKTIDTITTYESIILNKNTRRPDLNELELISDPRFLQGNIEVYKAIKVEMQWNPLHYGDPSAQKQFSKGTVIIDQNNFTKATVSYSSDISQEFVEIEKFGKGVGYFSSGDYGNLNLTWGGAGSDAPIMNIIPREKQRGRYLNVKFLHKVSRESVRVLGVSTVIRAVSDRAFR